MQSLMKTRIIATDKTHLKSLIQEEMGLNGDNCDLNHIDVSRVIDMSWVFCHLRFNGNIDKWDVSGVTNMKHMFAKSEFNQCISEWNVSNVTSMWCTFYDSAFDQQIARWDVSNVADMEYMFACSNFNQDTSDWRPVRLINKEHMFEDSKLEYNNLLPYWANVEVEFLEQAINAYELQKKLSSHLETTLTKKTPQPGMVKV